MPPLLLATAAATHTFGFCSLPQPYVCKLSARGGRKVFLLRAGWVSELQRRQVPEKVSREPSTAERGLLRCALARLLLQNSPVCQCQPRQVIVGRKPTGGPATRRGCLNSGVVGRGLESRGWRAGCAMRVTEEGSAERRDRLARVCYCVHIRNQRPPRHGNVCTYRLQAYGGRGMRDEPGVAGAATSEHGCAAVI